jgi:ABC-type transport system involved in multi-copper enzyme maturation permease subunit
MRQVLLLTKLYFLGSVRRQVHLGTLFLGVVLLMLPAYINAFSLGINAFERVSKDFGLTLIGYFGVAMSILLACSSIPKDLESRSLYPILARPIRRYQYITAHYLALIAQLASSFLFLGVCLIVALGALTRTLDLMVFVAIFTSFLQCSVVAAITLAASTVASPALAGTLGTFVFLVGSLPGAFVRFFLVEDRGDGFAAVLATSVKSALPNLSAFSLKDPIVHGISFDPLYVVAIASYALGWVVLALLGAGILFGRRDL